jgi:bacillithiol biosynthesis deacetylase BshB1
MILHALAFGAHPDDIELTCSGTLIKLVSMGYRIGVCSLTAGELSTRGNRAIRRKEFEEASRILGASAFEMLNLPDGRLSNSWQQKIEIIHVIRRYQPGIVFAPYWEDRHPDHANASVLIQEACFISGLKKIESGQEAHRPNRVLYYPSRFEFKPSFIVDISDHHEQKMRSILAYRSQFGITHQDEEDTNISQPGFLEAIVARSKQYGSYIGVKYGEPFLVREPLSLSDPVEFFGPDYAKSFV